MSKLYMKMAVMISAMVWNGSNVEELDQFMESEGYHFDDGGFYLYIETLEGDHKANKGDYIIKGVQGEFYPCKPDIFEKTYSDILNGTFDFGTAIALMKLGYKVSRTGWNGKGMYIWSVPKATVQKSWVRDQGLLEAMGENESLDCYGFLRMKTADGKVVSGWLASQTDILAEDWQVYKKVGALNE